MKLHATPPLRAGSWMAEILALAVVLAVLVVTTPARANVLEDAMATVFAVHSADAEDRFLGSAFLWGEAGEVAITNAHVVKDAEEVRLIDATGAEEIARVIARDAVRDVAVLAVRSGGRGLSPTAIPPGLGAEVWALGAPLGLEFTVTRGMISALDRQVDPAAPIRMVQHDAAVNPGSSGGPLVDATGALVGMNSQIADGSRMFVGIGYAIPAASLQRIVQGLIEETLAPLPSLGLTLRPVDRQLATALGIPAEGLLIDEVRPAGLAEAAGLLPGDVLLALGGSALAHPGDLAFAIEAAQVKGDLADLAVLRGGRKLLLSLSLVAAEEGKGLTTRDIAGAVPKRVTGYTLVTLGLTLDVEGRVRDVTPHSPALLAGIGVGDRIVAVNGQPVGPADLSGLVLTEATLFLLENAGRSRHLLVDPFGDRDRARPVGGANVLDPAVVVF